MVLDAHLSWKVGQITQCFIMKRSLFKYTENFTTKKKKKKKKKFS